jgi:hypothetical protein
VATATSSLINVTVNKNPNANITAGGATTFCAGGSVTLSEAPVGGSTYQWYKGAAQLPVQLPQIISQPQQVIINAVLQKLQAVALKIQIQLSLLFHVKKGRN